MKNLSNSESKKRRAYVRPLLTEVPLKFEEAVLGACKTSTSVGPNEGSCADPSACALLSS